MSETTSAKRSSSLLIGCLERGIASADALLAVDFTVRFFEVGFVVMRSVHVPENLRISQPNPPC
jgi:hypothetical protein